MKNIECSSLGTITFTEQVLFDLIETKEFVRLQKIKQLALVHFTFPGAIHTRYEHSLGVYELARRSLEKLNPADLSDFNKIALLSAALLHDVGHGPFSHLFEGISGVKHEEYTRMIILEENSSINKILVGYDSKLPAAITSIIEGKHELTYLNQLISSQVDVDRMDYLIRDRKNCRTSFGLDNPDYLIKSMIIVDGYLAFNESAIFELENLLVGRMHMFQSVYSSPKSLAASLLVKLFFNRVGQLISDEVLSDQSFKIFSTIINKHKLDFNDFISLDDESVTDMMKQLIGTDVVLDKIIDSILNQKTPSFMEVDTDSTSEEFGQGTS
ncbi:MAG: hypothetical protein DRP42_00155 [Tenericutes bacterium]|nr:MAG: hypothetical protein DRP42_00155 [Mycoplasmatota bacterium]